MGASPESRGDLPVGTVAVLGFTEAASRQDEASPTAVGAGPRRSRALPGAKPCASEAPLDDEAFLSLMARLSLRAVREVIGQRGSETNEID